jgi:hypothetical protein
MYTNAYREFSSNKEDCGERQGIELESDEE